MEPEIDKTMDHPRGETEQRPHRQAAGLVALIVTDSAIAKPKNQADRQYANGQPNDPAFEQSLEVFVFGVGINGLIRWIAARERLDVLERSITGPPNGKIFRDREQAGPQMEPPLLESLLAPHRRKSPFH